MVVQITAASSGNPGSTLGKVTPLDLNVTDITTVLAEPDHYMPWVAFSLINDGPNDLYVNVNEDEPSQEGPIKNGEQFSVDMERRIISKVLIFCAVGGHASVRLKARS